MQERQEELVALLKGIMPEETLFVTSIKGLRLFRIEHSFSRSPYAYNSEIIILVQGEKRVHLGNEVYVYDPSHYLVLPVPLPAECEGRVEPGEPILGLTIAVDPMEIGEILLDMEETRGDAQALPKGIYAAPMSEELHDAVLRLLRAIAEVRDRRVLAPMIKKEILYRVLQGEKGEIVQALARRNKRFFQIAKVLQRIHESYSDDFNVERLANELDMSSSTFHASFKAVTDTSPLQYIKDVRLHKARAFMIKDGLSANAAAMRVGYESSSQFNREYKRLFGSSPAKDATILRGRRVVQP
jgi:AraC-type DNA-binding domain-containing proteins